MTLGPRQIGGQNNKRGNRYEDFFATYKILEGMAGYLDHGHDLRLKEQTGSPIDDLLIERVAADHYHQLKSGQQTTWGQKGGKLKKEFVAQKAECDKRLEEIGREYQLVLVVPDEGRRKSLADGTPKDLNSVTSVVVFPHLERPSELAMPHSPAEAILVELSAWSRRSEPELRDIATIVYAAWIDHKADKDGFCCLSQLVRRIRRSFQLCRIRTDWKRKPRNWKIAQAEFAQIPGFTWTVERGYFEWTCTPAERGMMPFPCKSDNFRRFLDRVVQAQPRTLDELWMHFP